MIIESLGRVANKACQVREAGVARSLVDVDLMFQTQLLWIFSLTHVKS
jgi:hypothetical protein